MKRIITLALLWGSVPFAHSADVDTTTPTASVAISTPIVASLPEAAPVKIADAVAPVQGLVGFHEREIASLQKFVQRWNEKLSVTLLRKQGMEKDIASMKDKIATLQKEGSKKSKNEASRMTREMGRIQKDIKAVDGLLKAQSKELATELKDVSKDAQTALKDAYLEAITKIQQPRS